MKQIGTAFQLYLSDNSDFWPLAFGNENGKHLYDYYHAVPAGWRPKYGPGSERYHAYEMHWSNSLDKYIQDDPSYSIPNADVIDLTDENPDRYGPRPRRVSYAYNGLLHSFDAAGIVSPSELIAAWEGRGDVAELGFALSNPTLRCGSVTDPCIYVPGGPPAGAMFTVSGTMLVHNGGMQATFGDTHAKWRRVGAQVTPTTTDWRVDPFALYDEEGFPSQYWWDGTHPWLFRPGFDFSD